MSRFSTIALVSILTLGFANTTVAQAVNKDGTEVTLTVKGESWDADSRGFAFIGGLSKTKGTATSARRGSRVSVDGQPEIFAIAAPGPEFELTFTTTKSSFRLIVEGDRFPRTISQPFDVPEGGGEVDVRRIAAPRAEGVEHTWPLPMVATKLGYASPWDMIADSKAVIRLLVLGSGEDGAPRYPDNAEISVTGADTGEFAYTMDPANTFLPIADEPRRSSWIIVVPFSPGDPPDKEVTVQITDVTTTPELNPPRPWIYDPLTISVRNGFATVLYHRPAID